MTGQDAARAAFVAGVVAGFFIIEAILERIDQRVVMLVLATLGEQRARLIEGEFQTVCRNIAGEIPATTGAE